MSADRNQLLVTPTGSANHSALDLVLQFLRAMEARRLEQARALTAPGFTMVFPGGARLRSLEDLVSWASGRYRSVHKQFTAADILEDTETTVVYCRGTLSGAWPDGSLFRDVRFIDRFEVRNGLLTDQQVWNDLAETASATD